MAETQEARAITVADVPRHVADQIVRERVAKANAPDIGNAAKIAGDFYQEIGATTREAADLALCDALGVNRDAAYTGAVST